MSIRVELSLLERAGFKALIEQAQQAQGQLNAAATERGIDPVTCRFDGVALMGEPLPETLPSLEH